MEHDVIVIGGSYAGMSAALQLLRARRKVLIIDAGLPRNRFASHSNGFLGRDGMPPKQITSEAKEQLLGYQTLEWVDGLVTGVIGSRDDFRVTTADMAEHQGRRVLLATGVRDILPEIPGLKDRWGKSIFHCPYCHGYELNQGEIGILGSTQMSIHQAEMLAQWGNVTFFPNEAVVLDDTERAKLMQAGVFIEPTTIDRLEADADVVLTDGRAMTFAGLFVAPIVEPGTALPTQMGCQIDTNPMGQKLITDGMKQTSVPGVYACGDVGQMPHSVALAVGDGAMAGAMVHRSLIWPDA